LGKERNVPPKEAERGGGEKNADWGRRKLVPHSPRSGGKRGRGGSAAYDVKKEKRGEPYSYRSLDSRKRGKEKKGGGGEYNHPYEEKERGKHHGLLKRSPGRRGEKKKAHPKGSGVNSEPNRERKKFCDT